MSEAEARDLYAALWELSPRRGAISAAGKFRYALGQSSSGTAIVVLDDHETAALIAVRNRPRR